MADTVCRPDLVPMPGSLGRFYQEQCGGEVHVMGKPSAIIYERALQELGLAPADVIMVGDSMHHDIAGALSHHLINDISTNFPCGYAIAGAFRGSQHLE